MWQLANDKREIHGGKRLCMMRKVKGTEEGEKEMGPVSLLEKSKKKSATAKLGSQIAFPV